MLFSIDSNSPRALGPRCLRSLTRAVLLLVVCWLAAPAPPAVGDEGHNLARVSLQLKWYHQFQFAGYYAAIAKGYYHAAGLEVELREYEPGLNYIDSVLQGRADFGTAGSELLLRRMQGAPVVALAAIMQHSANVILSLREQGIFSPHDLIGKRVIMAPSGQPDLLAMLLNEGVAREQLILPELNWDMAELMEGRIDATAAYVTNTPFFLKQRDIPYSIMEPRSYGVDFYGDCLFTTRQLADKRPELVQAFLQASLKGWEYALQHPEEVVDLILTRYGSGKSREHLLYEAATLRQLVLPDLVQVGHMNPGRWQHMAKSYEALGMATADYSLEGFQFRPPDFNATALRVLQWGGGALIVVLLLSAWLAFFSARLKRAVRMRTAELSSLNAELRREIAVRQQVEEALRESEEALRAMSDASMDAMIMTDGYGKISFWSKGAERMFGYTSQEALGRGVHELVAETKDRRRAEVGLRQFSVSGEGQVIGQTMDYLARRKDGSVFPVEVAVTSFHHGGQWCAVASVRDATQRKRTEERLVELANTDELTGAANRRRFMELATQELERSRRYGRELALVMFDLDHFKQINDQWGHEAGDKALRVFVDEVRHELRGTDLVARFGGEEFLIMLPETGLDGARRVAERIRCRVENLRIMIEGRELRFTVSAGVARLTTGMTSLDALIKQSDDALYRAKDKGRNRVEAWLSTTDRIALAASERSGSA